MAAINSSKISNPETTAAALQSPRNAGESVSSPTQSRRATRAVSSPWTQIVRGESEPIAAVPSSPSAAVTEPAVAAAAAAAPPPFPSYFSANQTQSNSASQSNSSSPPPVEESVGEGSENGNAGKRPAWNKPSNGAVEVEPVMGAVSWPALSESARALTKSSSESLKGVSEPSLLSVSVSQGTGTTTTTNTSSPKQGNPSTSNHTGPTHQRSMRRNNSNASSNDGAPQHQSSAGQGVELPSNNPSPKEHTHRNAFGSQSHSNNDHPQQRNSFRNRNGGSHPRGEGSHHNYRRDQDRGNQDWNAHRNFNNRDNHMHSPRGVTRMMRPHQTPPPPNAAQFIHQPQMRAFGGPIGFDMQPHQLVYVTHAPHEPLVPFVAPLRHPMMFPAPDPQLHAKIINQIEYYFSNDNLIKDTYLRQNMDDQGWVRVKLILGFKKVMSLTDNIQLILDAMRMSTVVEVQGDKLRRRNDWMRWVMPPAEPPNSSGSQTPGKSGPDMLSAHIQSFALDEKTTNNNNVENNNQPQPSSGDGTGQFGVQAGADRSISARN